MRLDGAQVHTGSKRPVDRLGSPIPGSFPPGAVGRSVPRVNLSPVGVRDHIIQARAPAPRLDALTTAKDGARTRVPGGRVLSVVAGLVSGALMPAPLLLVWWRCRRQLRGVGALSRIPSRVVLWLYWWHAAVSSTGVGKCFRGFFRLPGGIGARRLVVAVVD